MELILKITWTWYGEEPSLALSRTNVIGVNQRIIRLECYAFLCFNLPFPREKTLKGKRKCKHPLTARKSEEKRSVEAVKVFCQNTTRPKGGVEIVTKTRRA